MTEEKSASNGRYIFCIEYSEVTLNENNPDLEMLDNDGKEYILVAPVYTTPSTQLIQKEIETCKALKCDVLEKIPKAVIGFVVGKLVKLDETVFGISVVMDLDTCYNLYKEGRLSVQGLEVNNGEIKILPELESKESKEYYLEAALNIIDSRKFEHKYIVNPELKNYKLSSKECRSANYFRMTSMMFKGIANLILAYTGDMQKLTVNKVRLLINYFNSINTLEGEELSPNDCLEIYMSCREALAREQENNIAEEVETKLFSEKKEKSKPVITHLLQLTTNDFFYIYIDENAEDYNRRVGYTKDYSTLKAVKNFKHIKGNKALIMILALALDKNHINKIAMPIEMYNKLNSFLTSIGAPTDYVRLLRALKEKEAQKADNK